MVEWEWLNHNSPLVLLDHAQGKISDRKLRLFTIGCFAPWEEKFSREARHLLAVGERLAEGMATEEEVRVAREHVCMLTGRSFSLATVISEAIALPAFRGAISVAHFLEQYSPRDPSRAQEECRQRCDLFRHLFGNPFRTHLAPTAWPAVVSQLAESLYEGHNCCLPLSDALEEAGHSELAEHFRQESLHPSGCWAMDLILGKS